MTDPVSPSGDFKRIRVGVAMPEDEGSTRAVRGNLDAFCAALSSAVGTLVSAQRLEHYSDLLDAMHAGHVDIAWLPPVVALRAAARGRTIPIALPIRGGTSSFHSALFARAGSPLKSAQDLRRVRAAWVDRQSSAGYLVIRASLRAQGLDLDQVFASGVFLGSHEAVVKAVWAGDADVGATFAHLGAQGAVIRAGWGGAPAQMIASAGPIPADVMAASIRMPVPQIRAIQRALCGAGNPFLKTATGKLFNAEGFVEARPEHLEPLNDLLGYMDDARGSSPEY